MLFLLSLLYLFATIAVVVAYLLIFYFIAVGVQRARQRYRLRHSLDRHAVLQKKLWPVLPKAKFKKITIVVGLILCLFYVQQRVKWMGDDNANLEAKEFWVAGQVVAGIRFAAIRVLHPENPLLFPLNAIQKAIYRQGIQYLPTGDGEVGVWTDLWLLYPYNYRLRLPYFVDVKSDKPSEKMQKLLDRCWFALERMATGTYADRQIKFEHYYRNFPALAVYYETYDGFYAERYIGSTAVNLKKKFIVDRLERLLQWLDELESKWRAEAYKSEIVSRHPIVESYRVITRFSILQRLLSAIIFNGEFSCDHMYVQKLYNTYRNLLSDDAEKNFLLNFSLRGSREQKIARNYYEEFVYSSRGNFGKFVLKYKCFKKLPDEPLILVSKDEYEFRNSEKRLDRIFKEEFEYLEKMYNE